MNIGDIIIGFLIGALFAFTVSIILVIADDKKKGKVNASKLPQNSPQITTKTLTRHDLSVSVARDRHDPDEVFAIMSQRFARQIEPIMKDQLRMTIDEPTNCYLFKVTFWTKPVEGQNNGKSS